MADPLHQFQIQKLVDFPDVTLPVVGTVDVAFTNSHLAMTVAFGMVVLFLTLVTAGAKVVPGRMQAAGETLFGMIDGLVDSIIGHDGRKLFPFVFTIFLFILAMNFLGLFLSFTATSQIAVTATFGVITILMVLAIGFIKHGLKFFTLFVPSGVPWVVLPFVVIIEFVSFLLRPVTLTLRLFGNMMGGHVALKVFAGFVVALGGMAAAGGLGLLGIPGAALSLSLVTALTALEFLVAFLQAFVFAVLTTIYLNDVVNLGHGH
jgi:F-type H+-transporting ATPase subunit a